MADDFKYEIVKELGTIGKESKGWRKEINLVSWNGRDPKLDIRAWGPERKIGKGISFNKDEAVEFKNFFTTLDIENLGIK